MAEPTPPPEVEAAALAATLLTALRQSGLSASPDRAARLAEALHLIPPTDLGRLYWTCRVVLVASEPQLTLFDAVFDAVFRRGFDPSAQLGSLAAPSAATPPGPAAQTRPGRAADRAPQHSPGQQHRHPAVASPGGPSDGPPPGAGREAVLAMASAEEHLHQMSFAALSAGEVRDVRQLARRLRLATPVRRSRRTRKSVRSSPRLDVRATVRAARRSGADTPRLLFARRLEQRRKLVLLCDVSASMEHYARVYLALLQGAVQSAGAEAFVFSTRLTRLTRQLARRDPDEALARAAAAAPDWSGGTRLAGSIKTFVDEHGRRGMARGAVVVLFSDGWAQDEPEQVALQMGRLHRLAHRIVWVNPRKAAPAYRPLVGGMAAALPFCDAFVSGHTFEALADVAAAIRGDGASSFERQGTS